MTSSWYLLLLLVPIAGLHVWASHRYRGAVVWWESIVGIGVGALTAWGCIALGQLAGGHDTETLSGAAYRATYVPEWKSNETRTETYTTGTGENRQTRSRTVRYVETHPPQYELESDIGSFRLRAAEWDTLCQTHGATLVATAGYRPGYRSGDRNDYWIDLSADGGGDEDLMPVGLGRPDFPVTRVALWDNRLEQSDSLLRLPRLAKGEAERLGLPDYPESREGLSATNRVVGRGPMPTRAWDRLNAHLGPQKQVNLILVYLGEGTTVDTAVKLKQHWRNGKKNDLVLCVDQADATWSYVFGWTKSDLVKQTAATALLEGPVDTSRIPAIWAAVYDDFEPYDWSQVARMPAPVPVWALVLSLVVTAGAQWGFLLWATSNEFGSRR